MWNCFVFVTPPPPHPATHILWLCVVLGLGISDKKIFRRRRNKRNEWFVPTELQLFHGTENSWNFVPNQSAKEKNAQNSVPSNKSRCKLAEIRFEPFRGRENNSEFRSLELEWKQTFGFWFQSILRNKTRVHFCVFWL